MMRTTRTVTASSSGLLWLTLMAGCNTPTAPAIPTLSPPPPSPALFTLSGVVYEHTPAGVRPRAGVPLSVSPLGGRLRQLTTDAEGRYRVSNLAAGAFTVNAGSPDHLQPCRAAITLAGDSTLDLHLVPAADMKATGIPPTFSVAQPTLSGRVFERTPEGVRAVPEAHLTLDFSGGDGWDPGAQSLSDSSGRYIFCNITAGAELGLAIWAAKEGYRDAFFLLGRPDNSTTYDVELIRK